MTIKIAPSILSADFSRLKEEVSELERCGADIIHCDVMDGVYVNNITFGMKAIADIRKCTTLPLDVHLMIVEPEKYIERFAKAGADYMSIHNDACKKDLKVVINLIKSFGVKAGIAISPNVELNEIKDYLFDIDYLLIMSVYPGFGGQSFIENTYKKIEQVSKLFREINKNIDIEIDGGVTFENVSKIKNAGANFIVAGNTVFKCEDKQKAIESLRNL